MACYILEKSILAENSPPVVVKEAFCFLRKISKLNSTLQLVAIRGENIVSLCTHSVACASILVYFGPGHIAVGTKAVTTLNKMLTTKKPPSNVGMISSASETPPGTPTETPASSPALRTAKCRARDHALQQKKYAEEERDYKKHLAEAMRNVYTLNGSGPVDIYAVLWNYLEKVIPKKDSMLGTQMSNEFWYSNSMVSELLCNLAVLAPENPRYDVYICKSLCITAF